VLGFPAVETHMASCSLAMAEDCGEVANEHR
jgi:hypothetical protein